MFAWDYDTNGSPVRFLRIERTGDDMLKAWAQNIIHVEKTTSVDWSLFDVDVSTFKTVYDQRGKYPIQTENGKVVFDASKDKYSKLPGRIGDRRSSVYRRSSVVRALVMTAVLLPVLIGGLAMLKKRRRK